MSSPSKTEISLGNLLFPFDQPGAVDTLTKSAWILLLASPLVGWIFFWVLSLGKISAEFGLVILLVLIVDNHQIPTYLFHLEDDHRRYMLRHPIRYYLLPLVLVAGFIPLYFTHFALAISIVVCVNGFHVGMQNYGVMRLVDKSRGVRRLPDWTLKTEKAALLLCGILPTAVFSLKFARIWSTPAEIAVIALTVLAGTLLIASEIVARRQAPAAGPARTLALLSCAVAMTPYGFFYRFDRGELAFLLAGTGHSLQYFACYRLYWSQRAATQKPERTAFFRKAQLTLLAFFGAITVFAWAGIGRVALGLVSWLITFIHIYYDSHFWKNRFPHFHSTTMKPLYGAIYRLRPPDGSVVSSP